MNQEQKKQRAPQIKKVLKKYGLKGTIGVRNYSTLYVTIKEGALDFIGVAQKMNNKSQGRRQDQNQGRRSLKPFGCVRAVPSMSQKRYQSNVQ